MMKVAVLAICVATSSHSVDGVQMTRKIRGVNKNRRRAQTYRIRDSSFAHMEPVQVTSSLPVKSKSDIDTSEHDNASEEGALSIAATEKQTETTETAASFMTSNSDSTPTGTPVVAGLMTEEEAQAPQGPAETTQVLNTGGNVFGGNVFGGAQQPQQNTPLSGGGLMDSILPFILDNIDGILEPIFEALDLSPKAEEKVNEYIGTSLGQEEEEEDALGVRTDTEFSSTSSTHEAQAAQSSTENEEGKDEDKDDKDKESSTGRGMNKKSKKGKRRR